jgi:hypothetical protein
VLCADAYNGWYGVNNAYTLYSINSATPAQDGAQICTDFKPNPSPLDQDLFVSFDVNKSSGLIYGVSESGNLYASNLPVVPIQLFTSPTNELRFALNVTRSDLNMPANIQTVTNSTTYPQYIDTGYQILGLYQTSFGYISCGVYYQTIQGVPNPVSNLLICRLDENFEVLTNATITSASINNGAAVFMCRFNNSMLCIYNAKGACYFYDETTLAVNSAMTLTGLAIPSSTTSGGVAICTYQNTLYWSSGSTLNSSAWLSTIPTPRWESVLENKSLTLASGNLHPQSLYMDPNDAQNIYVVGANSDSTTQLQLYSIYILGLTVSVDGPFINPNDPDAYINGLIIAQKVLTTIAAFG